MNHYISGIIKIMILEAGAALLLFDRFFAERFERQRKIGFAVLAGLMVFAWCEYGNFRVHYWEQFHFYLGAKYQNEVGWFDLYKAALIADRDVDGPHILGSVTETRDLTNFEVVKVEQALADAGRVRAQFSDERWSTFKEDLRRFSALVPWWQQPGRDGRTSWQAMMLDHGNSNSPAWAIFAHPIASLLPLTAGNLALIGALDMLLMIALWAAAYRVFGVRLASIGLLIWATAPNSYGDLAGSFLRWDWLFALGLACCFMQKEKWATAGALFGYAVASKLFPLFFGVALLIWVAMRHWKERKLPMPYVRFGAATLASGLAWVLIAAAMFGTFDVWKQYAQRIEVSQHEKFYSIQYSLKTVYLQVVESPASELAQRGLFPTEIKQARADVNIADHSKGFMLVQLLFAALIGVLLWRAPNAVSAFTLGPLLVFTFLTVNMYYWNMLGLLALGLAMRPQRPFFSLLLSLYAIFCGYFLYQHTNNGFAEGYVVALLLTVAVITNAVAKLVALRRSTVAT